MRSVGTYLVRPINVSFLTWCTTTGLRVTESSIIMTLIGWSTWLILHCFRISPEGLSLAYFKMAKDGKRSCTDTYPRTWRNDISDTGQWLLNLILRICHWLVYQPQNASREAEILVPFLFSSSPSLTYLRGRPLQKVFKTTVSNIISHHIILYTFCHFGILAK